MTPHPMNAKGPKLAVLRPFEVVIWGDSTDHPLDRIAVQAFSDDEAKADAITNYRQRQTGAGLPLLKIRRVDVCDGIRFTPQQRQRGLFEDLADVCLGAAIEDIQGAAINLLLTAVQRRYPRLADAEARWNELMGRGREALRRRYSKTIDARDKTAAESEIAKRLFA